MIFTKKQKLKHLRSQLLDWKKGDAIFRHPNKSNDFLGHLVSWDDENVILINHNWDNYSYDLNELLKYKLDYLSHIKLYEIHENHSYQERKKISEKVNSIKTIQDRIKLHEDFRQEYVKALKELNF